jgi:hypothetical protein
MPLAMPSAIGERQVFARQMKRIDTRAMVALYRAMDRELRVWRSMFNLQFIQKT